jgi:integrase
MNPLLDAALGYAARGLPVYPVHWPRPTPGGTSLACSRAVRRTVGLPRVVVEELAAHLGPVGPADAHVFTAEKGGVLRTSNFRIKVWLPAVRAAGLAPLRPHDLRHPAVGLWIAAGANPKEVSVRAGHTSVSFTLDRYGHLFPGHDTELRDRLDAMHAEGLQSQVT